MDFDGSQLWKRFKWELEGIVDLNYLQLLLFSHLPARKSLKEFVLFWLLSFFFCELLQLQYLCKRFCVLKQWISYALLTVFPNHNQASTPPSFLFLFLRLLTTWRDEISCCPFLNYPGCNRMMLGEEGNGLCLGLEWPSVLTAFFISFSNSDSVC